MRETLQHEILQFHPDTLRCVREACGLGAPGRVDEALGLLRDWLAKQEHFLRKDFPPNFLETSLVASKGSVEKTKQRLDLICTMRTFAPDFFAKFDVKNDFTELHDLGKGIVLPRMTEDHYRVVILKHSGYYPMLFQELYQYIVVLTEYLKLHDYCNGFVCIVDCRDVNIFDLVSKLDINEFRNIITLATKGYGSRLESIHLLSPSKMIELLVSVLSQVLSPKLMSRIKVHKSVEELHQHVPKRILPEDMGGEERSIDTLYDAWLEACSSEEHVKHMREMLEARTDESRRRDELGGPLFGLPGTFRGLNVD